MRPRTRGLPKLAMTHYPLDAATRLDTKSSRIFRLFALGEAVVLRLSALLELVYGFALHAFSHIFLAGLFAFAVGNDQFLADFVPFAVQAHQIVSGTPVVLEAAAPSEHLLRRTVPIFGYRLEIRLQEAAVRRFFGEDEFGAALMERAHLEELLELELEALHANVPPSRASPGDPPAFGSPFAPIEASTSVGPKRARSSAA